MRNTRDYTIKSAKYDNLTDDSPKVTSTPEGLRGLTLLPHQQSVIHALLELETTRTHLTETAEYKTIASALCEPFGSGKTYIILGMILLMPVPKPVVPHVFVGHSMRRGNYPIMSVKHTGPGVLIRANLIIVGASVLYQWEKAIKDHTNLRTLVIGDYYGMRNFLTAFNAKKLHIFDIILLKNGTMSGYLNIPADIPNPPEIRPMIDVLYRIVMGSVFARVIYDDYDTICIHNKAPAINSLFSVFVSATRRIDPMPSKPTLYASVEDMLKNYSPPLAYATEDKHLFKYFAVMSNKTFVEASTHIPPVHGRVYTLESSADAYTKMLKSMDDGTANEIMDMLNGDAYNTAAARLGITSNSPVDIFQRVLDDKYDSFVAAQKSLTAVDASYDLLDSLDDHPTGKSHSEEKCKKATNAMRSGKCVSAKYYSEVLREVVDTANTEHTDARDIAGAAIDRVLVNIKSGGCQVCTLDFTDGVFIMKCCGIVLCNTCYTRGNNIRQSCGKVKTLTGSCANCKKVIYPQIDTVFVDKTIDVQKLLDGAIVTVDETVPDVPEDVPLPTVTSNKKIEKLLTIIDGTAEGFTTCEINIKGLINRKTDTRLPDPPVRKLLVFTDFAETTSLISDELKKRDINTIRLSGTARQKSDAVDKFCATTTSVVLIINAREDCAGLNLQMATDAVMFQKTRDAHVAAQIAGRAQRIGRTSELTIHWLQYQNEL